MHELMSAYSIAITASVVLAGLILVQVLVADFAGIRARHVPGMPVTEGHGSFLFRAVRAHANTNETLGLYLLLLGCALLLAADPTWVNRLAMAYTGARALHMTAYYARWGRTRGAAFGLGLAAQGGLLVACVLALP